MKKRLSVILLSFLAFASTTMASNVLPCFSSVESDRLTRTAQVGFCCKAIASGETIAQLHAQQTFTPASLTKIITTASAIDILGADFQFKTWIDADTLPDADGILHGNLYLHGEGDPTLGSRYFPENANFITTWADSIKAKGIRRITGNIIAEVGNFDTEYTSPLWLTEDIGTYYGAGIFPLSAYDNTCTITFRSTDSTVLMTSMKPILSNENIVISPTLVSGGKTDLYLRGNPYTTSARSIEGNIVKNTEKTTMKCDINNPPLYIVQMLKTQLSSNEIIVDGDAVVRHQKPQGSRHAIIQNSSPSLSNIIRNINVVSNNNAAEHLIKRLSLQTDSIASFGGGTNVVKTHLSAIGIDTQGQYQYDGSGLTPKNAFSPAFIVDILRYMQTTSPHAQEFYASLPIAGKEGSVAGMLKDFAAHADFRMKSGSFRNVLCYAGYFTKNKKTYAFCVMLNNYCGTRQEARSFIEKTLKETYAKCP